MHFLLSLAFLFFFTACSANPEISVSEEIKSTDTIRSNQSEATQAQNEYKKLQAQREKE